MTPDENHIKQSGDGSLSDVTDLTAMRRKMVLRDRLSEEKGRAQNLLRSVIEKTGEDSMWLDSGNRHARARNGSHEHNVFWRPRFLLIEQFGKGEIDERDLSRYVVSAMAFVQRLKSVGGDVPDEEEVRTDAVELHESIRTLLGTIVEAVQDGVLDRAEALDLVDTCEMVETVARDLKQDAMSAKQSGTLPEAVEA